MFTTPASRCTIVRRVSPVCHRTNIALPLSPLALRPPCHVARVIVRCAGGDRSMDPVLIPRKLHCNCHRFFVRQFLCNSKIYLINFPIWKESKNRNIILIQIFGSLCRQVSNQQQKFLTFSFNIFIHFY